jgi:hypothetical protein
MDLDGTLLKSNLTISPGNEAAVAQFLAAGHFVALATGRVHRAAARYADHWPGHPVWVIGGNGSVVRPAAGGAPIYEQAVERDLAETVIRWAQAQDLNFKIYLDDEMWVFRDRESTRNFAKHRGIVYHVEPALADVLTKGPTKMVLNGEPESLDLLEVEARSRWDAKLSIIRSEPVYLEFMAPGVTKGTALAFLANHLGVDQVNVAAIGNERNDLAMIEWAGYGGVVANAVPAVKERAPRVVPHHEKDGVAVFIKEWLST